MTTHRLWNYGVLVYSVLVPRDDRVFLIESGKGKLQIVVTDLTNTNDIIAELPNHSEFFTS